VGGRGSLEAPSSDELIFVRELNGKPVRNAAELNGILRAEPPGEVMLCVSGRDPASDRKTIRLMPDRIALPPPEDLRLVSKAEHCEHATLLLRPTPLEPHERQALTRSSAVLLVVTGGRQPERAEISVNRELLAAKLFERGRNLQWWDEQIELLSFRNEDGSDGTLSRRIRNPAEFQELVRAFGALSHGKLPGEEQGPPAGLAELLRQILPRS